MDITADLIETGLADVRRVSFEKISFGSPEHPVPGAARHRVPAASFAALSAGDGGAHLTRELWQAEESRRVLLVGTLLTEIRRDPAVLGPLPPVAGVVDALAAAQRNAPTGVRRLLLDPQTGSGCADALRRLRAGEAHWADLGVVHALALAAAARAGLTWSTRLAVRHDSVPVPGLGTVRLRPGGPAIVDAHTEDGRIHLPGGVLLEPDRIRVGDELTLAVRLDDPGPPAAARRWHRLVGDAWELLCTHHRRDAEAIAEGLLAVVPGPDAAGGEVFGRAALAEPPDAVGLAVSLVRAYQRLELGALQRLIPLTGPDDGSLYPALWRDDPYPLAGLAQGVYASFGTTRFWRERRDTADGAVEYAYARRQTAESVRTVLAAPGLTARGRQLFEGLRARLDEWSADPADPRVDGPAAAPAHHGPPPRPRRHHERRQRSADRRGERPAGQ